MNSETIAKLKNILIEEKSTLDKELGEIGIKDQSGDWEATPEVSEAEADDNDLADKFEDYEERSAMLTTFENRLRLVEKALNNIENNPGAYGVCKVCNNPIEEDRLFANAAADTCKDHMEDGKGE